MPPLSVLDAIGNTPIVALERIVPAGSARLLAKLESANPTGKATNASDTPVVPAVYSTIVPPGPPQLERSNWMIEAMKPAV